MTGVFSPLLSYRRHILCRPWRAMEGQGPSSVSTWDDIGIELLPAYLAMQRLPSDCVKTGRRVAGHMFAVSIVSPTYSGPSVAGDGGPRAIVGLGLGRYWE